MNLRYIFEKTILPEWAIGIFAVLIFTATGSVSLLFGGGALVLIGGIVFIIYRNEVPWTKPLAVAVIAIGEVLLLLGFF